MPMERVETSIDGLAVVKPDVYPDARGCFFELYNRMRYAGMGLDAEFVQDNCSSSCYGTIRGLHYQIGDRAQGKLVTVLYGRVLDVAVDVRFGSPTFGEHVAVELSHDNRLQFWLPPGFAHGFSVLSETAVFAYRCTSYYDKECERSIRFDDPDLDIDWKVTDPIVSPKDLAAPPFRSIDKDFIFASEQNRV